MKKFPIIILILFFISGYHLIAQDVLGCTDPQANNFDPEATLNDGSCTYNPTFYNPQFRFSLPDELEENSGLITFNGKLWTINDSGNDAVLYGIDTLYGNIVQEIFVSNATNIDWESLTQDDDYIFIGDFGNNSGNRDDLRIYLVPKEDIPETGNGTVSSYQISYVYSDYPGQVEKRGENNFDCEAFVSIGDSLYLFSKNWQDNHTKLYRLPKSIGTHEAEKIYTFDASGLITGGDYNSASKEITLTGYSQETTIPFFWILFDYNDNLVFSGNKRRIDLLNITGSQVEAIAYINGKHGIVSNEDNLFHDQSTHNYFTGTWTNEETTGIGISHARNFDFSLSPNPVTGKKLNVNILQLPPGDYQIKIYDTSGNLVQIKEYDLRSQKSKLKVKLKIGHLKKGLYFVRMQSVHTIVEKKFIKQ